MTDYKKPNAFTEKWYYCDFGMELRLEGTLVVNIFWNTNREHFTSGSVFM